MDSPLLVRISDGQVVGCVRQDLDGGEILCFLGIPYAQPPIGDLRFKAPLPVQPWQDVRDATQNGNCCIQRSRETQAVEGSEDCLYLNIFTKKLPGFNTKPKPVMVWIHGGAFTHGSNNTAFYGPEFLMTEDIVLVSINYRLAILGFIRFDDASLNIPGNAGLKDQNLALQWMQKNIEKFNGDPNNVTIFGESAGGASVHYHVVSPKSIGLFHKAIMQSGVTLNPWATNSEGDAVDVARIIDPSVRNEEEAVKVLLKAPVEVLYETQEKYLRDKTVYSLFFAPVVEKPNETEFLIEDPVDLVLTGRYNKVPMIFGYNSNEGRLFEMERKRGLFRAGGNFVELDIEDMIEPKLNIVKGSEASSSICRLIEEKYRIQENEENRIIFDGDNRFVLGIIMAARNHAITSECPIYLYRMSVETQLNFLKIIGNMTHLPGVCHADDLAYVFKISFMPEVKPGSVEDIAVRRFAKLWTNFAKYGNPTPSLDLAVTWKSVESDGTLHYLDIGRDLKTGVNPESDRVEFWRDIFRANPATEQFL